MTYNFFATLSRMKYIDRWALMRNARTETLSEHTLDVAIIAHALCIIGNVRYGRKLDADRAALWEELEKLMQRFAHVGIDKEQIIRYLEGGEKDA